MKLKRTMDPIVQDRRGIAILSNHKCSRSHSGRKCQRGSRCCQQENGRCLELHGASICDGLQVIVVVIRVTVVAGVIAGVIAEVIAKQ